MRLNFLPLILGATLLFSCATARHKQAKAGLFVQKQVANSPVFSQALTGFALLDPESGKILADCLGDRLFTPASNVKILTLAACLEVLGDTLPGMRLMRADGKLLFQGTADPTFLHPAFQAWQTCFDTLRRHSADSMVCYCPQRFPTERFGPGWAWDDCGEDYQVERSEMPIYGNNFWAVFGDSLRCSPSRAPIFERLLADTLGFAVESCCSHSEHPYHVLYPVETVFSAPVDTVLRRMMHHSDNFVAEQLLLMCAGQKFGVLQQDTVVKWLLDSSLGASPRRPRWVDGSGLSRYNLLSPRGLAQVLLKLWREQPQERLFSLFPAGGVSGTLSEWYAGKAGRPYVWAKTGSMSGVHCLSGYVRCKSGKVLIFSFMHNHFTGSNRLWKQEMQRVLEGIWEHF